MLHDFDTYSFYLNKNTPINKSKIADGANLVVFTIKIAGIPAIFKLTICFLSRSCHKLS
jgi:hypothetical protein